MNLATTTQILRVQTMQKTFTGTVNLKTGETRAFNFSAGKGVADVLDPDTYYEVRVSEVEGNLSKVTYDTTKYILTFTTDRNAVVDYIGIAKQDNGEAFPELAPIEDDKTNHIPKHLHLQAFPFLWRQW